MASPMWTNEASWRPCWLLDCMRAPLMRSPPFPMWTFAQHGIICGRISVQNLIESPNDVFRCLASFLWIVGSGIWCCLTGRWRKVSISMQMWGIGSKEAKQGGIAHKWTCKILPHEVRGYLNSLLLASGQLSWIDWQSQTAVQPGTAAVWDL